MEVQYINYILTTLIAIVAYFLKQKDEKQQEEIRELRTETERNIQSLWTKHDQDAKDLAELRLHIASQHYVKTELDARFDKMELAFTTGFHELGSKMDKVVEALLKKE